MSSLRVIQYIALSNAKFRLAYYISI